jgi:hypothetical protein
VAVQRQRAVGFVLAGDVADRLPDAEEASIRVPDPRRVGYREDRSGADSRRVN